MTAASTLTRPHTSSLFICHSFSSCQVWRTGWPGTRTNVNESIYHQFKYCVNGQANWGAGPPCCKDIFNIERKILQRSCSSSCAKYRCRPLLNFTEEQVVESVGRWWDCAGNSLNAMWEFAYKWMVKIFWQIMQVLSCCSILIVPSRIN